MKKLIILTMSMLLCACASQPARNKQTASGWPEIEVKTSDKKFVKDFIIRKTSEGGWNLEQETDSTLFFTKLDTSGSADAAVTQVLLGNKYSSTLKYEFKYIISQYGDTAKIIANVSASTQMPMGQVNRIFYNENNSVINIYQGVLDKLKDGMEKEMKLK